MTITPGRKSLITGFAFTIWYIVVTYLYSMIFGLQRQLEAVDYTVFIIIFSLLFAAIHYFGVKKR